METIERHYFPPGPVAAAFMQSSAFVRGVLGPIGSGKSVACCMEIMRRAAEQCPGIDGVRRTRWVIVRNTYPELKSTTIKTWLDWFPEDVYGKFRWDVPLTHHIKVDDLDVEVLFLALDRPDHVKKLLSLEVTGGFINEAREIPRVILDGLTGRVGRYPSKRDKPPHIPDHQWPTWFGVVMDTNPPDDDHWWHGLAEGSDDQLLVSMREAEAVMRVEGLLAPEQPLFEFFRQPSGLDKQAENLDNLPPGYYIRATAGKRQDWIKVYVHGEYGSLHDGKPVYPEFSDRLHVATKPLAALAGTPILIGWDFGLTPAAIVGQITPRGQFRILAEYVAERMGIRQFARDVVKPAIASRFTEHRLGLSLSDMPLGEEWRLIRSVGDPAGVKHSDTDESSCFQELYALGFMAHPAKTNNLIPRREAVAGFLTRLSDGEPTLLLDPSCKQLRKGFNGGYRYRKMAVPGEERFTEAPDKNSFSHPHDALQYLALELAEPVQPPAPPRKDSWRARLKTMQRNSPMSA